MNAPDDVAVGVSLGAIPAPAALGSADTRTAVCSNCAAPLLGPYCAHCGQEAKPLDPPLRSFAREFLAELLDIDGRVLRSLKRLVLQPGFLTREHVEGRRVPWLSPLKLYLLTSVAAFAMVALAGGDGGLRIEVVGDRGGPLDVSTLGFASDAELAQALNEARAVWLPRVVFVLVPVFAALVALVRRRSGRRYPSHFVFALHVHAAAFAMRAVGSAVSIVTPAAVDQVIDSLLVLYLAGYLPMALRRAYGGSRLRAAGDTAVVGFAYWMLALMVAGAVVIGAAVAFRGASNPAF